MKFSNTVMASAAVVFCAGAAASAVCDYRPSSYLGNSAAAAAAAGGAAMKSAGFYTLVHSGSQLTLLGATLVGTTAAETIGIIAGTGGALGTVGAFLMAPATLIAGGVALVGIGGLEAACYFKDERVTDYGAVLSFMEHFAANHPADRFALERGIDGRKDDSILIWNPRTGELDRYLVVELYIVNGNLMHRKFGKNRNLGQIVFLDETVDTGQAPGTALE